MPHPIVSVRTRSVVFLLGCSDYKLSDLDGKGGTAPAIALVGELSATISPTISVQAPLCGTIDKLTQP